MMSSSNLPLYLWIYWQQSPDRKAVSELSFVPRFFRIFFLTRARKDYFNLASDFLLNVIRLRKKLRSPGQIALVLRCLRFSIFVQSGILVLDWVRITIIFDLTLLTCNPWSLSILWNNGTSPILPFIPVYEPLIYVWFFFIYTNIICRICRLISKDSLFQYFSMNFITHLSDRNSRPVPSDSSGPTASRSCV